MTRTDTVIEIPPASLGTQRGLQVRRYGHLGARPKAYLQTGLHADEIPGMLVMHHLTHLLDAADRERRIRGEIILVPIANPIGLSQYVYGTLLGRYELGSGANFNRQYPDITERVASAVREQLTEDASANVATIRCELNKIVASLHPYNEVDFLRATLLQLAIDADICLDLHCDGQAVLHLYLDTSCWPAATDLSAQIGSRATLLARDSGGNPFDESVAGVWWKLSERFPEHPIPTSCLSGTIELRGSTDVSDQYAIADAHNLSRFLIRRGVIVGDPGPLPSALCEATPLEGVDMIKSPAAGVVVYRKELGDWIEAGETVATIVDPFTHDVDHARHEIVSRINGLLFARRSDRMARPGQTLCRVAGATPLADRVGTHLLCD